MGLTILVYYSNFINCANNIQIVEVKTNVEFLKSAIDGLRDCGLDPIDINQMSLVLTNVAKLETACFENQIACLSELQYKVLDSVAGFGEKDSTVSEEKYNKLMARGLENAAEAFPDMAEDANLKTAIECQLGNAINALRQGYAEKKSLAMEAIRSIIDVRGKQLDKLQHAVDKIVDTKLTSFRKVASQIFNSVKGSLAANQFDNFKVRLEPVAQEIADGNLEKRPKYECLLLFLWTNLLLAKPDQYAISPTSGFMTGFFSLPMEALDLYLGAHSCTMTCVEP